MVKLVAKSMVVLALALGGVAGHTTVLLLDGIEADAQSKLERPKSGMTMASVEKTYGEPTQKHAAVGQPPITRWDYAGFSVYFEYDRVLHAVAKH
ncbi:MAG TPA: hypothetical protein VMU03_10165 [Gammaproteobacteria bacterium]|jgi:hypothetical protein|nr:hypothetical protein [Gammaproteobacteria bacterium]